MAKDLVTRLKADNSDLKKKLDESKSKIKELESSVKRLNSTLQGNTKQVKQLVAEYNKLSRTNNTLVEKNKKLTQQYGDLNNKISNLKVQLGNVNSIASNAGINLGSFGSMLGRVSPLMMALTAAFAASAKVIGDNIELNMELGNSLSSLKAIAGETAEGIDFYRLAAIQLGRVTPQTATLVADALKVVAQMKPELTKNRLALVDVTEASLALANALDVDVATAADIVTRALNVYGASAREAGRYINVLAAGSRNGSGDIEWLGNAFGKAGAAAVAVNMSYEETITTLELLSKRIKDSTSAGAQLRNILVYLEKTNDNELKPSVVGVSLAIKNLADRHYDLTTLVAMFKKQNLEAITTLIDSANEFDNLKEKVTDTNTAYEMAATKLDNLSGALKRLQSAWDSWILDLGNSNGILQKTVDLMASIINSWSGYSEAKQKAIKASRTKTDEILFNNAYKMVENGSSREDIKKELQKKIEDRQKIVQLMLEEALKKYNAIPFNDSKRDSEKGTFAMQITNYKGQLEALKLSATLLDMILDDAFNDYNKKKNAGNVTLLDEEEFNLATATVGLIKDRMKELKKVMANPNLPITEWLNYNNELKECKERLAEIAGTNNSKSKNKPTTNPLPAPENMKDNVWMSAGYVDDIEIAEITLLDVLRNRLKLYKDLENQINELTIASKLANGEEIEAINAEIELLKTKKEALGNILTNTDKLLTNTEMLNSTLSATASIMNGIGAAAGGTAGQIVLAFSNILNATIPLIAAILALSLAEGVLTAVQSSKHYVELIAAVASVVSTIIATFSMAKYATGGIVGGSSYSGDNNIVRVNSGEMILNRGQLARLFKAINSGDFGGSGNLVEFKLRGQDLIGLIKNTTSKNNKLL